MKAYEVSLIKHKNNAFESAKITGSKDAEQYARKFYHADLGLYESFFIMLLNNNGMVVQWAKISQGGITGAVVDPIIITKYAVETLAKSVILVHNHPSGNLKPSEPDKTITQRIRQGLSLFDCSVLDHIILTEDGYYSFNDEGQL